MEVFFELRREKVPSATRVIMSHAGHLVRAGWEWRRRPGQEAGRTVPDDPGAVAATPGNATQRQRGQALARPLACNFLMASHICFRCWEFWSLGGLEDFDNFLQNSSSPNLPAAKAINLSIAVELHCPNNISHGVAENHTDIIFEIEP